MRQLELPRLAAEQIDWTMVYTLLAVLSGVTGIFTYLRKLDEQIKMQDSFFAETPEEINRTKESTEVFKELVRLAGYNLRQYHRKES